MTDAETAQDADMGEDLPEQGARPSSPDALLKEIAVQLEATSSRTETVRTLLAWFEAERRGAAVSARVRDALAAAQLRTEPNFEDVSLDTEIRFLRIQEPAAAETPTPPPTVDSAPSAIAVEDAVPRIGMLPSANRRPTTTTRDATVAQACSVMLANDFSQLPVVNGPRQIVGMFSWKTLGEARAVGRECLRVRDCMAKDPLRFSPSTPLLEAVDQIAQREVALVVHNNELLGIITTTDLSRQFHITTRPFLLLGSIENQLRGLLAAFPLSVLQTARSVQQPPPRPLESVYDMTFGEYLRLLQSETVWAQLSMALDRGTVVSLLDEVRRVRNDVMHFHPDPVGEDELRRLENALRLLHMMRDAPRPGVQNSAS